MTFVIKVRGAPRPILSDFRCPVHGVFTALVDSGADAAACPVPRDVDPRVTSREADRRIERGDYSGLKPCGFRSPWSPSVIPMRVRRAQATTGRDEAAPHANWNFQRDLEEGQSPDEYDAARDAAAERRRGQLVVDAVRSDR